MKRLAILGASGHGLVVADAAQRCGWSAIEFFDDAKSKEGEHGAWKVSGDTYSLYERVDAFDGVVVAIGANHVRERKHGFLRTAGADLVSIIHPAAIVSAYSRIGAGSVVFAGAVVNAGAQLGKGVILNTACSVDHDCVVQDYAHISPGANLGGNVSVGERSWVGIGASVRHGIRIGRDVTIGAGAAVVADVADSQCVVGVPARVITPRHS